MALLDDLKSEVKTILRDAWEVTSGRFVPVPSSVGLGNRAIELDPATVLYVDIAPSAGDRCLYSCEFLPRRTLKLAHVSGS